MKSFIRPALFLLLATPLAAQELFPSFYVPGFRGNAGTEYSHWDIFSEPYAEPNWGDVAAAASNPELTQVLTPTAFLTSGFNIYSFSAATGYSLNNTTTSTIGTLNSVVLQFETLGTYIDYETIRLNYAGGSLAANNRVSESRVITGGFGGFTNRVALQWNLTGLDISGYTITFQALGSSNSFNVAVLDTSANPYTEVVASARTWDGGGGTSLWSGAANWSGDSVGATGATITFNHAAPENVVLDSNREIGQLNLEKNGAFTLSSIGGSVLTINTGINQTGVDGSAGTISANVHLGGHLFAHVDGGNTLTLSGLVSGEGAVGGFPATGINKQGGGRLVISNNNTFQGGVIVDGGEMVLSGSNSYSGTTSVREGRLTVAAPAPNGSNGALGSATSNVSLGSDGSFGGPAAELFIQGDHAVGRNISLTAGSDVKRLGATGTTSGATFSGSILHNATASNVEFEATGAGDMVTFSGAMTGGGAAQNVYIQGAGRVVYSGTAKTYASATTVRSGGTLLIAEESGYSGNGNITVQTGATLAIRGTLSGTGNLVLQGARVTGNGTIQRAFTLDSGAVLAPGSSPGTINTVGQTWGTGGGLHFEVNDVDAGQGIGWDFVNITGSLNITASTGGFTLQIDSLSLANTPGLIHDFNAASNYSWRFLTASAGITGFNVDKFNLDLSGFSNFHNGTWSVSQIGNDLYLNYATAIPEPSAYLLLVLGLGALAGLRRMRSRETGK